MTILAATPDRTMPLFGTEHNAAMLGVALTALVLTVALRRTADKPHGPRVRQHVCLWLAVALIVSFVFGQLHSLAIGIWALDENLPLHLCDIGLWVATAALLMLARQAPPHGPITWSQRLFELSYFWGLGGTSQAIVTPDVIGRFPEITCLRYFFVHGGIVVAVLVMLLGLRMRPQPGALWRVWWVTLVLAVVVFGINFAIDSNYMYLRENPPSPSLFDLFGPWPWSLLVLVFVGTLLLSVLYAPFWVYDRLRPLRRGIRNTE